MSSASDDALRIVVLLKQVPEVTEQALDPETGRLRREDVALLLNPFDRRAALEACRLRDELGGCWLVAMTMGPPQAESVLRDCLALGFDEAVHLCDATFAGADTLATARALHAALEPINADLILAGRYSIDSETGQVPAELAAMLGATHLPGVRRLEITASAETPRGYVAVAECESDDGAGEAEATLPVVATCTDRWKTRVPRLLPDEDLGARAPVRTLAASDLDVPLPKLGAAGSPTCVGEVRPIVLDRRREKVVVGEDSAEAVETILGVIERVRAEKGGARQGRALRHAPRGPEKGGIVVVGELGLEGELRPVTAELLGVADGLAAEKGLSIAIFLLAPPLPVDTPRHGLLEEAELAALLGACGADYWIRPGGEATSGGAVLGVLEEAVCSLRPTILLGPATSLGRDQLPHLAAHLELGMTGDAIAVEFDEGGEMLAMKPAFGGQLVAPIRSRTTPAFATLRPGVCETPVRDPSRGPAQSLVFPAGRVYTQPSWRNFHAEVDGELAGLEQAGIVVCAGFGLGGPEGVERVSRLAAALEGAVCGTRRVCDLGWLPRQSQVGLSGRSIAPDLYMGFGVRGSFNHTVGIRRAGTVIGVNTDADADLFAAADLGFVGDATPLLEGLLARVS